MNTPSCKVLGITGGIGSGKSVVARCLRNMDIPVYNCDDEAKRLNDTHPAIRQALTALIGNNTYDTDGHLNKSVLATYLFADQQNASRINAIIHPHVMDDFLQWKQRQVSPWVAIESAILFESGFNRLADKILTVSAPEEIRIERAVKRDHTSPKAVRQRMRHQMSDDEKVKLSDYIVLNDEEHPIIPQILDILANLLCKIPQ